ncbi:alpha-ketoglutarate decarboxylase [Mesonia aquimarina]|uniref:alpha-ketoglutarate decarboxylase n=1 Tax=Mesonia aquimarina TaxID=1504967 RepID=UPI000EF564A6|nr:alpha-ketoglutarate decarboxylase [Mesonia aquimarina]
MKLFTKSHLHHFIIVLLFSSASFSASAQFQNTANNNSFMDNVRFGGGLGLSFGNDFFSGSITPSALYQVNQYFATGVGLNFTYSSFDNDEAFVYGGSIIGIVSPLREIQLSAEFEQLRVNRTYRFNGNSLEDDYWYPALFLGAGYNTGPVTIGVRYDVLYDDEDSIYASPFMPFVRVYF